MTAPKAISFGFLVLAASSFMVTAHAESCFKNDTTYDTKVWYIDPEGGKAKIKDVAPGDQLCSDGDYEGYVGVVIMDGQPPSLASVNVSLGGSVRIVEAGGRWLNALDKDGKVTMQDRFAKPYQ